MHIIKELILAFREAEAIKVWSHSVSLKNGLKFNMVIYKKNKVSLIVLSLKVCRLFIPAWFTC